MKLNERTSNDSSAGRQDPPKSLCRVLFMRCVSPLGFKRFQARGYASLSEEEPCAPKPLADAA